MASEATRTELVDAIKTRALFYHAFYKEFSAEIGREKTAELMKRAIYKRGFEVGKKFRAYAPNDFEGLRAAFLGGVPDEAFNPEVHSCSEDGLEITLKTCPLKAAWQEAGLSDEEIVVMTDIAGQVDKGTFEGAGFAFDTDTWLPGRSECCRLCVRPGQAEA